MIDDPEELNRRAAWLQTVKDMGRRERALGLTAILIGAGVIVWSRTDHAVPDWAVWIAYGLLAAGWAAFIYVIVRRSRWVRANPFEPNA